jgi:hypothetical protein
MRLERFQTVADTVNYVRCARCPAATRLILRTAFRMPSSYSMTTLDTGAFSSITSNL